LHILWFILAVKILVCDFRNLLLSIKKAIKNDKKYINFCTQLMTIINKTQDLDALY